MDWLLSSQGIATIIQIFILIVLILTFLHAHRPYVGIICADSIYDKTSKDFTVTLKIKNTGNVPANNVCSNMKMKINSKELGSSRGASRYVLFPNQENLGSPKFHNVEIAHLQASELKIAVEIHYEQPIGSFLPIPVIIRKYKTIQELLYEPSAGKFSVISGCAT